MSKHLSENDVEKIVRIIDGLEVVRWGEILKQVERRLSRAYSRQALRRHARIAAAIDGRRRAGRISAARTGEQKACTTEGQILEGKIQRLEAQLERLERENGELLEQFVRWSYNATALGVPLDRLDAALPATDLDQTADFARASGRGRLAAGKGR